MALEIAEGISGVWYYHLRDTEKSQSSGLCGRTVMQTAIPLSSWGTRSHLNEGWCSICARHLVQAVKP